MVMYRDFAARHARLLNISGETKNMPDGTVEVVAQGEEDNLKRYIKELEKGPIFANVERVDVKWQEPRKKYDSFKIIY
jgi:acylphosphatase